MDVLVTGSYPGSVGGDTRGVSSLRLGDVTGAHDVPSAPRQDVLQVCIPAHRESYQPIDRYQLFVHAIVYKAPKPFVVTVLDIPNIRNILTDINNYCQSLTQTDLNKKQHACRFANKKVPAASLKPRKWGLGIPIHIKML